MTTPYVCLDGVCKPPFLITTNVQDFCQTELVYFKVRIKQLKMKGKY